MLIQLLRRPLKDKRKEGSMDAYKEKFGFGTDGYPAQKWGLRSFTTGTVYLFNKFVHEVMMREMYGQVATSVDLGQGLHDSINDWIAKYDFTEKDLTFDALKKAYQRMRLVDKRRHPVQRQSPLKAVKVLRTQLLKLPVQPAALSARPTT
jgi:hypothetical protein